MYAEEQLPLARDLRPLLVRINHMVRRRSPGWDITAAQTSVLTTLLDHGPMRMGELARIERVRMPTATSMVSRLEKMGLASRTPDPHDRRAVLADITADGRAEIEALSTARNRHLAALLGELTEDDRERIAAAIPALARLVALDPAYEPTLQPEQSTSALR